MNLKSRKLADIDQEIWVLKLGAITGQILHRGRHDIQVLEDDRVKI